MCARSTQSRLDDPLPLVNANEYMDRMSSDFREQALSVRSWFVLSEDSVGDRDWWHSFDEQLEADGWFINRTRQRSDGMFYIYVVRPGHRSF